MRKYIALTAIAFLFLTAVPALAHDGSDKNLRLNAKSLVSHADEESFWLKGKITAKGSTTLTVTVDKSSNHEQLASRSAVTVIVDDDAKVKIRGTREADISDLSVNDQVVIRGEVDDGAMVADMIAKVHVKQAAFGTITAKNDSSVTISNNLNGTEKQVTINPETKIIINGEVKTASDIQVGDRGVVRFKAVLDTFVGTMIRLFR